MALKPNEVFGVQLRAVREARGWSQRELLRRLAELGVDMDPATLHRTETHQRGLALNEALALAAALEVSPLHLIVPTAREATVEIAPKVVVSATNARRWVTGQWPLPGQDRKVFHQVGPEDVVEARRRLELAIQRETFTRRLVQELSGEGVWVGAFDDMSDEMREQALRQAQDDHDRAQREVLEALHALREVS